MPNRVYAQYRNKPKAYAWYNIVPALSSELEQAIQGVRMSYDVELNATAQLDVIGRIIVMEQPYSVVNNDEIYRTLIRSKIAKNNSEATLDGVVSAMQFIIQGAQVIVGDYEDMTMDVSFLTPIDGNAINLLNTFDVLTRPQGVRFRGYAVLPLTTLYGDDTAQYGDDMAEYGFYFGGTI